MRITQEMTDELNEVLADMGCSFKFRFSDEFCNSLIEVEPMNGKFIESSIINLTDEFYEFLEKFFKGKGIEKLCYNNAGSAVWSKNGRSVCND